MMANQDGIGNQLLHQRPDLVRRAWVPILTGQAFSRRPKATRFGGARPYRWAGFKWPRCIECNEQKAFVCQIEGQGLPPAALELTKLEKDAFLQVFLCLRCREQDDGRAGLGDDIFIIREPSLFPVPRLQDIAATVLVEYKIPLNRLPPELIDMVKKFTEKLDKVELKEVEVADWQELRMEIPMDRELIERWGSPPMRMGDLDLDDVLTSDVAPLSTPVRRVKIGGWVDWKEGPNVGVGSHYPKCPDCKAPMTLPLLQLVEEEEVHDCQWGDEGTASVTRCPSCLMPALDYTWDPLDFDDVYDFFDVRFVNGRWRMVDEEGDFMHNDSASD